MRRPRKTGTGNEPGMGPGSMGQGEWYVWWGMCGKGASMAGWVCMAGGMCGWGAYVEGGHAWRGTCIQERRPLKWVVRILLECILVCRNIHTGLRQGQGSGAFILCQFHSLYRSQSRSHAVSVSHHRGLSGSRWHLRQKTLNILPWSQTSPVHPVSQVQLYILTKSVQLPSL